MRAYLLGYAHGQNDGYFSTLIKDGRCEKLYDESLDAEYVTIDEILEIVDDADKKAGDKTYIVLDDGRFYSQTKYIKEKMLELRREVEVEDGNPDGVTSQVDWHDEYETWELEGEDEQR